MLLPPIQNQKSKIGFYFHIPFCPHICPYCDFVKTSRFSKINIDIYFQELYHALDKILQNFKDTNLIGNSSHCTVYFGGGTPSLFDAKFYAPLLKKLSQCFLLEEVTIESNPFTNKDNFVSKYREIGIDRITLGAQSLCDKTLQTLGRKHTQNQILNNIKFLNQCGFTQIQVDLIYGLSSKRTIPINDEIKRIIDLGATGISAYGLTIEPRTRFGQTGQTIVDEDTTIHEYSCILDTCLALGLKQIETSNFSFFDAKHNNLYWHGYPYFGIGTGAHGLLPPLFLPDSKSIFDAFEVPQHSLPYGIRYQVGKTPKERTPGDDLLEFDTQASKINNFKFFFEAPRTHTHMMEELIFTLLRTEHGIPIDWLISETQNSNILDKIIQNQKIKRGLDEGNIIFTKTHIKLSAYEKLRGNAWALIFISVLTE